MTEAPQRRCGIGQCALAWRCQGKPGLCLGWGEEEKVHEAIFLCVVSNQICFGEGKVILQCMQQAW